jgi:C1A family cysteine protease
MDAKKDLALAYQRVSQDLLDMKSCLAAGFPMVIGFTVYQSFESDSVASSGVVPMPAYGESVLGGHAVLNVGYDDQAGTFIAQNSWGTGWGQKGFFTLPQAYLVNSDLASDFWTLRKMEE